jgi:hypothetical protein
VRFSILTLQQYVKWVIYTHFLSYLAALNIHTFFVYITQINYGKNISYLLSLFYSKVSRNAADRYNWVISWSFKWVILLKIYIYFKIIFLYFWFFDLIRFYYLICLVIFIGNDLSLFYSKELQLSHIMSNVMNFEMSNSFS